IYWYFTCLFFFFFFSSRRRHTRFSRDWSSDVCSSDLFGGNAAPDAGSRYIEYGGVPDSRRDMGSSPPPAESGPAGKGGRRPGQWRSHRIPTAPATLPVPCDQTPETHPKTTRHDGPAKSHRAEDGFHHPPRPPRRRYGAVPGNGASANYRPGSP